MHHASRKGRNIFCRKGESAEDKLKPRRIFRISFMWLRRFTQVVAQGRRWRALQKLGEYSFRAILLEPWSGVESIEFGVREPKEHTVGASSG
jgi:hypothetical protein